MGKKFFLNKLIFLLKHANRFLEFYNSASLVAYYILTTLSF